MILIRYKINKYPKKDLNDIRVIYLLVKMKILNYLLNLKVNKILIKVISKKRKARLMINYL